MKSKKIKWMGWMTEELFFKAILFVIAEVEFSIKLQNY